MSQADLSEADARAACSTPPIAAQSEAAHDTRPAGSPHRTAVSRRRTLGRAQREHPGAHVTPAHDGRLGQTRRQRRVLEQPDPPVPRHADDGDGGHSDTAV
ncbi:hypothetical protein [Dactylosporangium aurantiacum]|uniref:hypothetical protein n=1 Tax=Dactylosporangium aurantiacum TaxID=35754 RepID=UPI00138DF2E6|nr:hypothetical protein [Dactylosporangium aurantiacum]